MGGMPSLTTDDGVRLDYDDEGRGRPVVLVAGFKAARTSWRYQVPALLRAGYRVIAVDLRGHGTSSASGPAGATMARRGADLDQLLTQLDLRDAALVGGSMGGNTVWSYLSQFPQDRVTAVVIVDQTPRMLNADDWPYGFYDYGEGNRDTFFATSIPDPKRHSLASKGPLRIARLLRAMDTRADRTLTPDDLAVLGDHATADWRPTIAATTVPALFVAGAESDFWPSAHAAAAAALSPLASSVVIERDGHPANIEQWREFNRVMLEFIGRNHA